jgi:putative SOS response-associated peptidase YedK
MCFSVNVNIVKEELEKRYRATLIDRDKYTPSYYYHAFSYPEMPVISSANPEVIGIFKWGLIPSGTRNIEEANEIRKKTFNARAESIDQKITFSESFKSKRCIVPVKGFFEWQHRGNKKIPWYISHYQDDILSLAGLCDRWQDGSGIVIDTFTIITTVANDLLAKIHNSAERMPAILDRSAEIQWLDASTPVKKLNGLLDPVSSGMMKAHTIGPLINRKDADKNNPAVIQHYDYPVQNLLF